MKLSEKAIGIIDNKTMHSKLALALDFTDTWIRGLINKNKDNSPLTTMAAMKVIREETGLTDQEILEEAVTVGS